MSRETAHQIRGMVARVAVGSINDSGGSQTADVTVYAGVDRSGVEVAQPYGFASVSPGGGLGLALAVGGDQGDLVIMPIGNPAYRLGNLAPGEAAMHGMDGSRVHVKLGGIIETVATKRVELHVADMFVEIDNHSISVSSGGALSAGNIVLMATL